MSFMKNSKVMFKQGDIVWIKFPLADQPTKAKRRPAVIVSNQASNQLDQDYLVAQITSRLRDDPFSVLINSDQLSQPIPKESEIRCNKLATVRSHVILGYVSSLKEETLKEVIEKTKQAIEVERSQA